MSIYVRNNTASTIPRGRAVYSDGTAGGLPRVALARADAVGTMPCIGITLEAIDPSQDGRVGTTETVTAMDTSAFTLGDLLYVSAATAGALTATLPASPNIVQRVGRVTFVSVRDGRLSLNVETANFAKDGAFEIAGSAPELRLKETDQVGPAGEYRWHLDADQASWERALTAGYATVIKFLKFDFSASQRRMLADEVLRVHWDNPSIEIWHESGVKYTGDANSGSYTFGHRNSALTHQDVLRIAGGTSPGGLDEASAEFLRRTYFTADIFGPSTAVWNISANRATSDATERFLMLRALNSVGDAFVDTLAISPNGATPMVGLRTPAITPTTTLLPATFCGFVVDGSDQLTAYFNKAGAIKSLVIGTLV